MRRSTSNTVDYGDGPGGADGAGAMTVNAGKYEFVRARGAIGTLGCAGGQRPRHRLGRSRWAAERLHEHQRNGCPGTAAIPGRARAAVHDRDPRRGDRAPWLTNTTAPVGLGTGGVLAIDVQGTLTVNTGVAATVDGLGFRGAAGRQLTGSGGASTDYRSLSTVTTHGSKGEGNAGTPQWIFNPAGSLACGGTIGTAPDYYINTAQPNDGYPNGSMARGAPATRAAGRPTGTPPPTTRTRAAAAAATAGPAATAATPGTRCSTTAGAARQ